MKEAKCMYVFCAQEKERERERKKRKRRKERSMRRNICEIRHALL